MNGWENIWFFAFRTTVHNINIHTHTKYLLMNMYIHIYKRFIYAHIYEKGVYLHRSVDIHTHTTKADQCISSIIKTKMAQVRSFKTCK